MISKSASLLLGPLVLFFLGCEGPPTDEPPQAHTALAEGPRDSIGKVVGPISQEIMKANADNDRKLGLLARVEVQANELVEFYEPDPGRIVISIAGAPSEKKIVTNLDASDPEALWRRATNGRAMPAELQAAIVRSKTRTVSSPARDDGGLGGEGGAAEEIVVNRSPPQQVNAQLGYCDSGFFAASSGACPTPIPGYFVGWHFCRDNWWNGLWAQHNDAEASQIWVCPATGPVTLWVENEDSNFPVTIDVPTNTARGFYSEDRHCRYAWNDCPRIRAEVRDAAGDRFHFRMSVDPE